MQIHYDALVIGGGVIGASTAYHLSKMGYQVAILEKNQIGCEASGAAAGILGAQAEIDEEGPLLELAIQSRSLFPNLVAELKEKTNIDVEFIQKGLLKVAATEAEAGLLKAKAERHRRWDSEVKWLSPDAARQAEPLLTPDTYGAISIPKDGQLMPAKLTQALVHGALYHQAAIYENCHVHELIYDNKKVVGVRTSAGNFYSDQVMVSAGAWTKDLVTAIQPKHLFPIKGECISLTTNQPSIQKTIFLDEGFYVVPKAGGRIVIGATKRPHDYTKHVSAEAIEFLISKAISLVPSLAEASFEKAWAGLRPQTVDGWPYLGQHPELDNVYLACGHYRNGILLSAITGKIMAEQMKGENPKHSFFSAFRLQREMEGTY
ncbi:glycine oxidase ThiO [Priestia aryabhattai]|nr:glycine oxidase ThiO [Nitratireductor sp. DP7N14-4]OZT11416.1 glycine oxidase ThiO [Priestia aryabhattai]USY55689.1 glycine oxidase ThiO [Bacillus sp. 1780r2a1]